MIWVSPPEPIPMVTGWVTLLPSVVEGHRRCCRRCSVMAPVGTTTTSCSSLTMMETLALVPP